MSTMNLTETARSTFSTGQSIAMQAVWADDPVTQIATNLVIVVAAMLSSAVTWGIGLVIAGFALFFLGVGVVRLAYQLVM